ncbi:unnamed protein product [Fusarium venenatum]|uniref:Uncharacterized protein n=1 Tax=Fusarium venenatum TaxID=56646 RepID=A0A2L2TCK3_9HYPO|nr:uncharacterized protein FVRRES_08779 [Fusarium venenatum]CEI68702.1 unnamed protein product [Fusarium venenatum]
MDLTAARAIHKARRGEVIKTRQDESSEYSEPNRMRQRSDMRPNHMVKRSKGQAISRRTTKQRTENNQT